MQQILGGEFKGRRLQVPQGKTTRPTLAIMRKALFDILQQDVQEAAVLDLFAGSGSIGLEALSRGAKAATFVESDRGAIQCLKGNITLCKADDDSTVLTYDVFLALKKLSHAKKSFDLIYADPPYGPAIQFQFLDKLLRFIDTHALLNPGGRLFLEEASPETISRTLPHLQSLTLINTRQFSRSLLHQFQQKIQSG